MGRLTAAAARLPGGAWLAGGVIAAWALAWWWNRETPSPDQRGPVDRATDVIYPPGTCARAMNDGDIAGASWHCRPGTFAAWLMAGRPKGCSVLEDGKISCPAPSKPASTPPVVGGGGEFGGRGASGTW